jgi:hypothetical protein
MTPSIISQISVRARQFLQRDSADQLGEGEEGAAHAIPLEAGSHILTISAAA